jgi:hypothetical protein
MFLQYKKLQLIELSVNRRFVLMPKTTKKEFIASGSTVLLSLGMATIVHAAGVPTLNEVVVKANSKELIGTANSANEGTVLKHKLDARTVLVGELLESVPGLIVTQHSGEGKANQYFARI